MNLSPRRINYLQAHCTNNNWKMRFNIYSYVRKTLKQGVLNTRKPQADEIVTESWPAADIIKKIITEHLDENGEKEILNIPITLAAKISITRIELQLPQVKARSETLSFSFRRNFPLLSCILEFRPDELQKQNQKIGSFVVSSIFCEIPFQDENDWPDSIRNARVRARKIKPRNITPKDLLNKYFGIPSIKVNDSLILDSDGIIVKANQKIPWRSGNKLEPGFFRYIPSKDPSFPDRIKLERDSNWINDLRKYQNEVVESTEYELDNGFPSSLFPSIGLAVADTTRTIEWAIIDRSWKYDPPPSLFEVDIRGSAGGVSRVTTGNLAIEKGGLKITCHSGNLPDISTNTVTYQFSADQNVWKADFEAIIDPDSQETYDSIVNGEGSTNAWLLTSTGPISLPIFQQVPKKLGAEIGNNLLKGLIRLSEVPWNQEESDLPPWPDMGNLRFGTLLMTDAAHLSVEIFLKKSEDGFNCESIQAQFTSPKIRMEDVIPTFLSFHQKYDLAPPPLPDPTNEDIKFASFSVNSADKVSANFAKWKFQLEFKPGVRSNQMLEGDWVDSTMAFLPPTQIASKNLFWFKPDQLSWLPTLPLYADPRELPDIRINQQRILFPLEMVPNQPIVLKPLENWYMFDLEDGYFTVPKLNGESGNLQDLYAWTILSLPGIQLKLKKDQPIRILKGRPSQGGIEWIWEYEIPSLKELYTLQTSGKKEEKEVENSVELEKIEDWWSILESLSALSSTPETILFTRDVNFSENKVLNVQNLSVSIANLYADQKFAGRATINLLEETANLDIKDSNGNFIKLIESNELLRGPKLDFGIDYLKGTKPQIFPVENGDSQITAGTFPPTHFDDQNEKIFFDHTGTVFGQRKKNSTGRLIDLSEKGSDKLKSIFQWYYQELDLSTDSTNLVISFIALPLLIKNDAWIFEEGDSLYDHELIREFTWNVVGKSTFWGLNFQPFLLHSIRFEEGIDQIPQQPIEIIVSGVFHFRNDRIDVADGENQLVTIKYVRTHETWTLEQLEGQFSWSLFAERDTQDSEDKQLENPTIEGNLGLVINTETNVPSLQIGDDNGICHFKFFLFEREWSLPVIIREQPTENSSLEDLIWTVQKEDVESELSIVPIGGKIKLTQSNFTPSNARVSFLFAIPLQESNRFLTNVQLEFFTDPTQKTVKIKDAKFLIFNETNPVHSHLLSVSESDSQIRLTSQQVHMVINIRPSVHGFNLFSGWKVEQEDINAFLTVDFTSSAVSSVKSMAIKKVQFFLECSLKVRNDSIQSAIKYSYNSGKTDLQLKFTGRINFTNLISWPFKKDPRDTYSHKVSFLLKDATIPINKLDLSVPDTFFDINYSGQLNKESFVGIPTITEHEIVHAKQRGNKVLLKWTCVQELRFFNRIDFIELVLLRGKAAKSAVLKSNSDSSAEFFLKRGPSMKFEASEEVEHGFVGRLGNELEKIIRYLPITILESSEAFWLSIAPPDIQDRSEVTLWNKNGRLKVIGIPCSIQDFSSEYIDSYGGQTEWYRLALPFINDTRQTLKYNLGTELRQLLQNKIQSSPIESPNIWKETTQVSRIELFRRKYLDTFSLESQRNPSSSEGIDQVILYPEARELLVPYTDPDDRFEAGFLTFYPWHLEELPDTNIPFSATKLVLDHLAEEGDKRLLIAATERSPRKTSMHRTSSDEDGSPFLIASPLLSLREEEVSETITSIPYEDILKQPRLYNSWKGLIEIENLKYIPYDLKDWVVDWVNFLPSNVRRTKKYEEIEDAPGGYSRHGYGLGVDASLNIITKRNSYEDSKFPSIESLMEIEGFGIDKLSDLIYAASLKLYPVRDDRILIEVKILLEIIGQKHESEQDEQFGITERAVFLIGISNLDTWSSIIFRPDDEEEYSKVRIKVWDWVKKKEKEFVGNLPPILRATILTPIDDVPDRVYFLLNTSRTKLSKDSQGINKITNALIQDKRLIIEKARSAPDDLLTGPELIGSKVYFEPNAWKEPQIPVIENSVADKIISFSADRNVIDRGQKVKLKWQLKEGVENIRIQVRASENQIYPDQNFVEVEPEQTSVYILQVLNAQSQVEQSKALAVGVRRPASGSGVGLAFKVSSHTAGPSHDSRKSENDGSRESRWLEFTSDWLFKDYTRDDNSFKQEIGWLLPGNRPLDWDSEHVEKKKALNQLLPSQLSGFVTAGRPGALVRHRLAILKEKVEDDILRNGSSAFTMRHPRPVKLPQELFPYPPEERKYRSENSRTCSFKSLPDQEPFKYFEVAWKDPVFNRRLHAVGQEKAEGPLVLKLDRRVYGGKDFIYPEINLTSSILKGKTWKINLVLELSRFTSDIGLASIARLEAKITDNAVVIEKVEGLDSQGFQLNTLEIDRVKSVNDRKGFIRYALEIGLDQLEAEDYNIQLSFENNDRLQLTANLVIDGIKYGNKVSLNSVIRTDIDTWPQPQNAFAIIRKYKINELFSQDLAAFGWLPKPKFVKRRDRFDAGSWEGTFKYLDCFIHPTHIVNHFEIKSITSHGEQM